MGNAIPAEEESTGLIIVGQRKENRKTMTSAIYSWEKKSVENSKKRTTKNILKNRYVIVASHPISLTRRKT